MDRARRINEMIEWMECVVDVGISPGREVDPETVRAIGVLTNLYLLKQQSVRMARQKQFMDDALATSAREGGK